MLFKKIKINKRLIRKAEFLDGFECNNTRNNFLSIYINPTGREIMQAKAESRYGSIRGLIMADGTSYCWCGDVLHDKLPSGANLPVNSGDAFRFACEGHWIFDLCHLPLESSLSGRLRGWIAYRRNARRANFAGSPTKSVPCFLNHIPQVS